MHPPSWELAGIVVVHPATCLTNVLLAIQCGGFCRHLRRRVRGRFAPRVATEGRAWHLFFLFLGVATAAGALKHGFPHYLEPPGYALVVVVSGLAAAASTAAAGFATVAHRVRGRSSRRLLRGAIVIQLLLFLLLFLPSQAFHLVVIHTAIGFLPILVAEWRAARRGDAGGGWVAGGLGLTLATGAVYLLELAPSPWFNEVDVAHVLLMLALALIYRGVTS